jgi:hypothetical protein
VRSTSFASKISSLALTALLLGAAASRLVIASEVDEARLELQREVELIQDIAPHVERQDLGRLLLLKGYSENVIRQIERAGLGNMATLREYQFLIVGYRYSAEYFSRIKTEATADEIAELLRINDRIIQERGFDDSPYTQITRSVFGQMHRLFVDLGKSQVSPQLRARLLELDRAFADVVTVGGNGDRPKTFDAGSRLAKKIRALYPEFDQIAQSHPAFNLVISIQGLNEFYAEYAQIK